MDREVVALARCLQYEENEVEDGVSRALKLLGGMESFVKPGDKVLLKPNLLAARPPHKAVTTHPLVVKAVGKHVKDCGGILSLGDSPALGSWKQIISQTGMGEVATFLGAKIVQFQDTVWLDREEKHQFKKLEVARAAVENDVIINLPKLKTHTQMFLTLGVKNIFGFLVGKRKPAWHMEAGDDYHSFAKRIVELYETVAPSLTLLDGIIGMEGDGPGSGDPKAMGLIAAGRDAVALDRVVLELVGGKPKQLYTNQAAEELGIGVTDLQKINIIGEALEDVKITNFKFPHMTGVQFGIPFLRPYIRDFVTTHPLEDQKKCTLCGQCIRVCPPRIIREDEKKGLRFQYDECIRCYCCLEVCPEGAMEMKQGLALKLLQGIGWW